MPQAFECRYCVIEIIDAIVRKGSIAQEHCDLVLFLGEVIAAPTSVP